MRSSRVGARTMVILILGVCLNAACNQRRSWSTAPINDQEPAKPQITAAQEVPRKSARKSSAAAKTASAGENACGADASISYLVVSKVDTPVFVQPNPKQQPLTRVEIGTVLPLQRTEGDWFLVQFEDRRWGSRVGYVHCSNVAVATPRTSQPQAANTPSSP